MNIDLHFHISVPILGTKKIRGVPVTHFYASSQVHRFRITGDKGDIVMEKLLDRKRQPWKITSGLEDPIKLAAAQDVLIVLQNGIDQYLEQTKDSQQKEGYVVLGPGAARRW